MTSLVLAVTAGGSVAGCLDRPVVPGEPTTKTNFTTQVQQTAVDKLDILFSIDNSASMGDKQAYLEQAIPDLITRLVSPNCVNSNTGAVDGPSTVTNGTADCSMYTAADPDSAVEFPPVHNMHIGIVSSSLGPRLGDKYGNGMGGACDPNAMTININGATLLDHNDDQAHLLTRSSDPNINLTTMPPTEMTLTDATPSGFLAWYPTTPANPSGGQGNDPAITTTAQLETDFADLVAGVHQFGCGIESQLENWYRFLIQPDPYASLALNSSSLAEWVGVDTTIIKERHDFLRPDSLVAIIVLTDENDSEIDVRSLGGQGYVFMSTVFDPPHGTPVCSTNPADPGCASLGSKNDPNPYSASTDWGYDLNLRHVHMKAKYGIDPQYPIERYQVGLTSNKVPDRNGEYPSGAQSYQGLVTANQKCTNPLFAASLPDGSTLSSGIASSVSASDQATLCNLPQSTQRAKSLVFYAIIGGVPWQLLHFDPTSPQNSLLSTADWTKILGTDPDNYNYQGIDPHMIESYAPRTSATFTTAPPLGALMGAGGTSAAETAPQAAANVTAANGGVPDPYNGREWVTNSTATGGGANHVDLAVDREYACIFKLNTPRDCTNSGGKYTVPANANACDCSSTGLTPDELSPVCNPTSPNQQLYAKAYPTIRELNLANKMQNQGIVSSICPIDVADNTAGTDPLYGYRPAVASIINRLKSALTNQCLPQTLEVSDAGTGVPCLILVTLAQQGDTCANHGGLTTVTDTSILSEFQASQEAAWVAGGGDASGTPDPAKLTTCQMNQLFTAPDFQNGTCKGSGDPGWCYVTGSAAGTCPQAIIFVNGSVPAGATINLQCIETSSAVAAGVSDGG